MLPSDMAPPLWDRDDAALLQICLRLAPAEWRFLRASSRGSARSLSTAQMRRLFARQLQERGLAAAALCSAAAVPPSASLDVPQAPARAGPRPAVAILAIAAAVEASARLLDDLAAQPRLAMPGHAAAAFALCRLHGLAWHGRPLTAKERSGRRATCSRRLLRTFGELSGLLPRLVALLLAFPPAHVEDTGAFAEAVPPPLPPAIFRLFCELFAILLHNTRDAKVLFLSDGGLDGIMAYMRACPEEETVQSAALSVLLALSARSTMCIEVLTTAKVHDAVAAAARRFPAGSQIVSLAMSLLANMSNVPRVCPLLRECGVEALALQFLEALSLPVLAEPEVGRHGQDDVLKEAKVVRDFVCYLLVNLQDS